jgi:hypothetical protein
MIIYNGDKIIETHQAKTATSLKNLAKCPLGKIYKNYNKGRVSLKVGNLYFKIDQIRIVEEVVNIEKKPKMKKKTSKL